MKIYLASTSKRRIEILKEILKPFERKFEVISPEFSEIEGGYPPEDLVLINARGKVDSILKQKYADSLIISADTIVALEGVILGKPSHESKAKKYLEMLSQRTHSVFTGVVVFNSQTRKHFEGSLESRVTFNKLSPQMIKRYISKYQPFDKAGGYGIQELKDDFIKKIEGSYSNIVGLSEELTLKLLFQAGLKNKC